MYQTGLNQVEAQQGQQLEGLQLQAAAYLDGALASQLYPVVTAHLAAPDGAEDRLPCQLTCPRRP